MASGFGVKARPRRDRDREWTEWQVWRGATIRGRCSTEAEARNLMRILMNQEHLQREKLWARQREKLGPEEHADQQ